MFGEIDGTIDVFVYVTSKLKIFANCRSGYRDCIKKNGDKT